MMKIVLSNEADNDLEEIYEYTRSNFSIQQANVYLNKLISQIERLGRYPNLGMKRAELTNNIKSLIIESHVVFYKILKDSILVVRILHHSRDFPKHIKY